MTTLQRTGEAHRPPFIFLAFGLSYLGGRTAVYVVAVTIGVALVLLVTSVGLRWTSGVPDNLPDVLANAGGP